MLEHTEAGKARRAWEAGDTSAFAEAVRSRVAHDVDAERGAYTWHFADGSVLMMQVHSTFVRKG